MMHTQLLISILYYKYQLMSCIPHQTDHEDIITVY